MVETISTHLLLPETPCGSMAKTISTRLLLPETPCDSMVKNNPCHKSEQICGRNHHAIITQSTTELHREWTVKKNYFPCIVHVER